MVLGSSELQLDLCVLHIMHLGEDFYSWQSHNFSGSMSTNEK